jgi:hypothetical protein
MAGTNYRLLQSRGCQRHNSRRIEPTCSLGGDERFPWTAISKWRTVEKLGRVGDGDGSEVFRNLARQPIVIVEAKLFSHVVRTIRDLEHHGGLTKNAKTGKAM